MPEPKTIAIGTKDAKLEFTVPQPYNEGQAITAVEAKVLNQTFAENIGNNFRARVQATMAGEKDAMSEVELRAAFDEYASKYEFTEASAGGGRSTMTPVEKEARKIATQVVIAKLAKDGKKRKDVDKEAFDAEVARFAEAEQVLKLAAKKVRDDEKQLAALLEAAA